MSDFKNKISRFISRHALVDDFSLPVGVAVSGGADSVALLLVLSEMGIPCVALHCDFGLRGAESDGDRLFVVDLCKTLSIPCETVCWNAASERRPGESLEMCCRRLRYGWFEDVANRLNLSRIALGHHREDSEETMLLNLFRGTGPDGLRGIAPRRGIFIRPMLSVSRREIEDYCLECGVSWRVDSSNASSLYRRNVVRNQLMPLVGRYFPDFSAGLGVTAENMTYTSLIIERHLSELFDVCVSDGAVDVAALIGREGPALASRSLMLLIHKRFQLPLTLSQAQNICRSVDSSGLFFEAGDALLELSRGVLRPVDSPEDVEIEIEFGRDISAPIALRFESVALPTNLRLSPRELLLDSSVIDGSPRFTFRHPRQGDRLKPFGMKGSRLLSDIFSDLKMSAGEKRAQWVLTRDGEILWLVGIRASRHFPVTSATTSAYLLTLS